MGAEGRFGWAGFTGASSLDFGPIRWRSDRWALNKRACQARPAVALCARLVVHPALRRCPSGKTAPAFTSPSEKLVWMSFTLGSLNSVSIAQRE